MREIIHPDNIHAVTDIAQLRAGWISDVRWSPEGATLAVASGNTVRLYINGISMQPDAVLSDSQSPVKSIAFSANGHLLAGAGADLTVFVWNVSNVTLPPLRLTGHTDALNTVTFSADGRWLAGAGAEQIVYLWEAGQGAIPTAKLTGHEDEITSLAFMQNGHQLLSGSRDGRLRLWDVSQTGKSDVIEAHDDWIRALTISPDERLIASASKDGIVRLWDSVDKTLKATIQAHKGGVDAVSFSPDGRLLATGGRDFQIRLWDMTRRLETNQVHASDPLSILSTHTKPVMALAFNPTGTMLASGSGDNTVRLWGVV